MAELLLRMLALAQVILGKIQAAKEVIAVFAPVFIPIKLGAGLAEKLKLHLLKFPCAEDEVARSDLVAEGFTDLCDTEGDLFAHAALDVQEVDEDTLRRLGTQIDFISSIFVHALEGLKHHIELANAREIGLAALGADDTVRLDVFLQLLICPAVGMNILKTVLIGIILDELISAEARLACTAVHERVVEIDDMAACHPNLGVHEDGAVHTDIIRAFLNEFTPPGILDIVQEEHPERAVIPAIREAAVNFRPCKNVAPVLTQSYNFIHRYFFFHKLSF